jgi:hypothetical protein
MLLLENKDTARLAYAFDSLLLVAVFFPRSIFMYLLSSMQHEANCDFQSLPICDSSSLAKFLVTTVGCSVPAVETMTW